MDQPPRDLVALHQRIIDYYETCDTDYAFFWHLKSRMAMHYGYWNENTKNLKEALWNMNDLLAGMAVISSSDFVLDSGCGIGGSSFYLADKIGCRVHGITLSNRHVAEANSLAEKRGVKESVVFSARDFCNTHFPDAHFDVVWALESVCHAREKSEFIREAYRILKPGGRLVVGDFFQKPNLKGKDLYLMQRWAGSWSVPSFETSENFEQHLKEAGFSFINPADISFNIRRSAAILYRYFIPGLLSNWIMPLFGKRKKMVQKQNVWSVRLQYISLKKGLWQYLVFTAVKPE